MRVLHVAECIGGVDRYLRGLLKYSKCENIVVLSQLYNKEDYDNIADYVEIIHINHSIDISAIKEAYKLRQIIKKYNPDIVYAHSSIAGAITRMACIMLKPKVIYNPHGWSFNMENNKQKIYVVLEKFMAHFCDAIVCISDAEKQSAIKAGICKKEKLKVIYNGIDIDGYKKGSAKLQIPKDTYVVGMVGRICKQKAPDIFIKMAGEIKKKINNSCFVIVGDVVEGNMNEKTEIEKLSKKLGVNLIITGWVENPLSYMEMFDVGCLLSRWEGFGLAIPEYMLTQTPIVATNVDAIPYLITDEENGLLVEKNDWKTAAEKVLLIINDKTIKEKLVKNGEKTVRSRFDIRRMVKQCEKLYSELTEQ